MARYCYISDKILQKYIKNNLSLIDLTVGRKYESLCALLIKIFFEERYKIPLLVGFEVKDGYKHIPVTNVKTCKLFFQEGANSDTLVDFCVSPICSYNEKINQIQGWTFQLKRFGKFQTEKNTEGLIQYLEKLKNKYPKNNSAIVIFFDGHRGIDISSVCKDTRLINFPFETIFFIETNKDKSDLWRMNIGQMWPIYGYNAYDASKAIKKGILENVSYRYTGT